ncbi:FG-GAP-like repeat-containing protein [Myxococcus xanthus]|uniref:FG-GAP-like repeat-containing protein n=1 Tax=Myxococcus xanthus TaxID=34 RepID=UPI00112830B7|nr:FG-GAP-like repeat-containing protein [Myxococcus xanthus]
MKMVIACGLLCLVSSSAWGAGEPVPGALNSQTLRLPDGPGSVRGLGDELAVNGFSAQIQYGVPFELPRGRGGFSPTLALSYSGEMGNGLVGVGWSLPVMSIRRSLRHGVPAYTPTDELELVGIAGGGRLVALQDGTWRLEGRGQEVKVERSGAGFLVTENGGTRYFLGTAASARQESATTGQVAAWFAEEVLHPAGHRVALQYSKEGGQVYPVSLAWGPGDSFLVELLYEERPDVVVSYRSGFAVETAKRLKHVRVTSFDEVVRMYHLTYENSLSLSRLVHVEMTGRGGEGALPMLSFSYAEPAVEQIIQQTGVSGWILNSRGVSLADVDGDGMSDLLRIEASGHSYKRGTGSGFASPRTLPGPAIDLANVRLMDLDGDARPELVRYLSSSWRPYRLNGFSWVDAGSKWQGSDNLPLNGADYFFADLNGDGRVDVIQRIANGIRVKLNGATGLGAWISRPYIGGVSQLVPGPDVRFHDVNGDGLADVVQLTDSLMRVFLGRGDGNFVLKGSYSHPWGTGNFPLADVRLCDLNRDGLMDVVRLSASHVYWYAGKAEGGVLATARFLARPGSAAYDSVVAIADVNGNGSEDVVWSSQQGLWVLDLAGRTSAGMLVGVDNGLGKTVSLDYSASAILSVAAETAGQPWEMQLPVSVPVPVTVTVNPGAGGPPRVVEHSVRDGFWDGGERRFGGFLTGIRRQVGTTLRETLIEKTLYHAGFAVERVLRGVPLEVRTEDGNGKLFSVKTSQYEARVVDGLPSVALLRKAAVLEQRIWHHEGTATPVETLTTYAYDTRVRPVEELHSGRLDLQGDEKTVIRAYASDDALWIQDVVCEEKVLEADGTLVSHSRTFYGDASQVFTWTDVAACRVGRLVREKRGWLEDSVQPRWVVDTSTEYDAWDNPVRMFENGVWRTISYDANRLHATAESVSPVPGRILTWAAQWDDVLGQLKVLTDPNGIATEVGYDSLGRLVTVSVAGAPPHLRYSYDWTAPAPRTTTYAYDGSDAELRAESLPWKPSPKWRQTVAIANGAGEALYTATRLLRTQWLVGDWVERDARGKVVYRAEPFVWAQASLPAVRPTNADAQLLAYDALGRLVSQSLPTGAVQTMAYAVLGATHTVQGMAPVHTTKDGLGRIRRTTRQVGPVLESVDATYDAADRIRTLRLQDGEATHAFTYDTLGRLVFANDPDIGTRTLRYADSGHLTRLTNGAQQAREYFYDDAGRLVRTLGEDGATFVYHYDVAQDGSAVGNTAGRMAWVEEPRGSVHFAYDAHGRVARQRRAIEGMWSVEDTLFSTTGLPLTSDVDGVLVDTTYDAAGRPVRLGNYWEAVELDAAGRVIEERFGNGVRQVYARDALGMPSRVHVQRATGVTLYDVTLTRNAFGAPVTVSDADGVGLNHSATFEYDPAARLTESVLGAVPLPDGTLGEGAESFRFEYAYDGLQNMVLRHSSGPKALNVLAGAYHYGERGFGPRQLTRVTAGSNETLMGYDDAGRLVQQGGHLMTYNGLDQLVRVKLPSSPGTTSVVEHDYGFDGMRVLTRAPSGDMQYWFSPQLTQRGASIRERYLRLADRVLARVTHVPSSASGKSVVPPPTEIEGATIDGAVGRLVSGLILGALACVTLMALCIRVPAHGRWRRWSAGMLAVSMLGLSCDTGVRAEHHAESQRAALWIEEQVQYFHGGVSAGPVLISRQDGSVLEERRYEPFGAPIDAYRELLGGSAELGDVDHVGEPLNVLNKLTEAHTGWSDHGARWMAPESARWLTPDSPVKGPEPQFLSSPWDLHPYQYVRQNPVLYWDPDGRFGRLDLPSVALAEACKGGCSNTDREAFQSAFESTVKEGLLVLNPIPTNKEELILQVATGGTGKIAAKLVVVGMIARSPKLLKSVTNVTEGVARSSNVLRGFHGTKGDNVVSIIDSGIFRPKDGKVWMSENVGGTFVHGTDRSRMASFSIEVEAVVDGAKVTRMSTPNVPRSLLIETGKDVPVQVRRLHVRTPDGDGGFATEVVEGAEAIQKYLAR